MKIYSNKMVLESLRLPLFEDIETLSEETRLTEKLIYFLTKKMWKVVIRHFMLLNEMVDKEK